MQLYDSKWLCEDWTSEDILFLDGSDGFGSGGGVLIDKPLVRSCFPADSSVSTPKTKSRLIRRNKSLLLLGIALLELWYASPFEMLRVEVACDVHEPDISTFEAAEQLVE
jgi:hypothetical protein